MKIKESKYQVAYLQSIKERAASAVKGGEFKESTNALTKFGIASMFSLVISAAGGVYCRSIGRSDLLVAFLAMFGLSIIVFVCWMLNSLSDESGYFSIEDISAEEIRGYNKKKLIAVINEAIDDLKDYIRQFNEDEKVLSEIKGAMRCLEDVKIIVVNDIAIFVSSDKYYAVHTDDVDFEVNERKNTLDFSADDDDIRNDISVIEMCIERLQMSGKK